MFFALLLPQVPLFPEGMVAPLVPGDLSLYLNLMVLVDHAIYVYFHEKLTIPTKS